jgi:hypothetical protein
LPEASSKYFYKWLFKGKNNVVVIKSHEKGSNGLQEF